MDFAQSVYRLVAQIPRGRVATYGQLAMLSGRPRGARQVGFLLARAPDMLKLPCHRVVHTDGSFAPEGLFSYPGGQRALLEQEEVRFTPGGRVDMRVHIWRPQPDILSKR